MTTQVHTYRCPCGGTEMKCDSSSLIRMICMICKRGLQLVEIREIKSNETI